MPTQGHPKGCPFLFFGVLTENINEGLHLTSQTDLRLVGEMRDAVLLELQSPEGSQDSGLSGVPNNTI